MDKKLKILFVLGIIIFIIVIAGINIFIKNFEKESAFYLPPGQINTEKRVPQERNNAPEMQKEEPEREPPIPSNQPLAG